jgi:ribulose-phosphate 3-epimerase
MDNIFVPNKTFDLKESERIIKESPLPVDAHLMIAEPEKTVRRYGEFGAASITFHYEATKSPKLCISEIQESGARVGIALKPATPFSAIAPLINEIDMVLVMTVEPGFGGQSFMSNMMAKVEEARAEIDRVKFRDIWLQVDGGISLETITTAFEAGADTFVAGSAVFKDANPGSMVDKLRAKLT